MRYIVAGCAGFIGYHLTERLLNEGHEIVGIDDLSTGQTANAADLKTRRNFTFVAHDIVQPLKIDGPVEIIFNLACPASPADFLPRRLKILDVCSRGVWNLLDLAREKNARLLHSSTSEVYGDPKEHPQRESYWGNVNPIGERACYDEGKRFAEALIVNYRRQHGVKARVARIFNTYGPRMRTDDGRVLPNFITQALAGRPLTIHGDGGQTRSFCYVADMADGLIRLAGSDVEDPVNIGNPQEITIREFAEEIIRLCGSSSTLQSIQRPTDDPNVRKPDITRARTLLGWEPKVDRRAGLERTVTWFKENCRAS